MDTIGSCYYYLLLIMMMIPCPWHLHAQRSCPPVGNAGADCLSLTSLGLPKVPLGRETEARKVSKGLQEHVSEKN